MGGKKLHDLRQDYLGIPLEEALLPEDPLQLFSAWFLEAMQAGIREPNAMALATSDESGQASARIVLLKEYNEDGFIFFTNYESRKGKDLKKKPGAALLFYWDILFRQVRIEGRVSPIPEGDSEAYFQSRPLESRISALVSMQSSVIEGRAELEARWKETAQRAGQGLQRPASWGGYLLKPDKIEFWQGQASRLHDRILFSRIQEHWKMERLAP